jgi:hypothetical protein
MVCACLPAIRALASHLLPTLFEPTTKGDGTGTASHRNSQVVSYGRKIPKTDEEIPDSRMEKSETTLNAKIKEFPTTIKTAESRGIRGYGDSNASDKAFNLERISDEVEFLDLPTAIPLRSARKNHIVTQMVANNTHCMR